MGFLAAREVAREKFGENSQIYRNLSREPELFFEKAEIVNRYHARLGELYAAARAEGLPPSETPARKALLFQQLQQACQAIDPLPRSFNKCLAASNNAGLAFDATYTRYYPMMYNLFRAYREDARATSDALKQALNTRSEPEAVERLRDLAAQRK